MTQPEAEILWTPSDDTVRRAAVTAYRRFVADAYAAGPAAEADRNDTVDDPRDYEALWRWSVADPDTFWRSLADWFSVEWAERPDHPEGPALADAAMPGARWFPGAGLNYARHVLRNGDPGAPAATHPALIHVDERLEPAATSWDDLRRATAALAARLRELGVQPGDRVAAYLPNVPQAVVGLLACAAVGAVWCSCAPDFGARSALDRLGQVEPVVLVACDGYRYGGRVVDRTDAVAELRAHLPGLRAAVHVPLLGTPTPEGALTWDDVTSGGEPGEEPDYEALPFDHPLWILFSSGTTGLPKAIVHGHGGILLEHLKQAGLHCDLHPGDRFFWYTSTGWMMWNFLVGGLLVGATAVLYDGSPAYPGPDAQWTVAERTGTTFFGTSAAYVMACRKNGVQPARTHDLSALRGIGTTGSPLPPDGFRWVYDAVGPDVWLASVSGGTDVCSAFVGGVPVLPVRAGEIQARLLGCAAEAWDEDGRPVVGSVGELVITAPMPSMPVHFWNDPDGTRYRESYFSTYPGVWRHGDWITVTPTGGVVVHGRSDSTLNRQGVRMGSADIYEAVERLPEVREALVIGVEQPDGGYWMPLFVVPAEGAVVDDALRERIRAVIREEVSPRHVPDEIIEAPGVPHTLTGKRIEVPVKRLLQGRALGEAVNPGSVDDMGVLEFYARLARVRAAGRTFR